eukprot:jgi/Bigna1/81307/fgenesh1_pg.79_\
MFFSLLLCVQMVHAVVVTPLPPIARAPTAQLKSRKDLAEHIRDVMIAAVQQEQMSMEDYLDLLRITIDTDTKLAKEVSARRGDEGKLDYQQLIARIKIMKAELSNAEASLAGQD